MRFTYGFDFPRPRSRAERLARLDALATLLDTAFILPGTNVRFGFDAIIGLVPGIGDAITTAISLYIVHEARQLGAPLHVIMRMLANVAVDGFVGAVPVFGDAFDVMWRANRRNVRLLREWLAPDLVALSAMGLLLVTGVLSMDETLRVFSNGAPVVIGSMFVLSAALDLTRPRSHDYINVMPRAR